jgi:riboflavin transporter FmnP
MPYFNSREVAAIALLSALWGVLNSIFAPIFFRMTGLPFLCDMVGFAVLILTVWWIRKPGAAFVVGIIATIVNFTFNPGGTHFLGFTAASIVFDLIAYIIGYERSFKNPFYTTALMLPVSAVSAALAGFIIGAFFMAAPALAKWGGVIGWAGLHAIGGVIGGIVGIITVVALASRGIRQAEVKSRMTPPISKDLLGKAVRLHGHLGPFLVFGLKMSLRAEEILGEKPAKCVVETVNRKPYLCAVDGVKAVLGKEAVKVREGDGLAAEFSGANGAETTIRVKRSLVEKYAKVPWEKCEEYANEVMISGDNQLFE